MSALSIFTERFNELLSERDLKPTALAVRLDIPKNTICRYARGAQLPNLRLAIILSGFFGCSIDYLLGRSDKGKVFKPSDLKPFSERLPVIMKQFKTNKYRIAKETALHSSILYRWQSGDCSPELESLIILADHLGCSVEYLLGRSDIINE